MTSLSRPSPSALLARLIHAPDLVEQVRALPNPVFAAVVRELGVEDAGELVAMATTEQLMAAFDEDLFVNDEPGERERFSVTRFITWLEVILEAGDEAAANRVTELSQDFIVHALSSIMLVFDVDSLAERLRSNDPSAEAADRALENTYAEQIDQYLLVSRVESGWDATFALVVALDRMHRDVLIQILDRCVAVASGYMDDLASLSEVLSSSESLADDIEGDRQARRARLGYVDPLDAKSFLALARLTSDEQPEADRDAITRDYIRELTDATDATGRPTATPLAIDRDDSEGLRQQLLNAGLDVQTSPLLSDEDITVDETQPIVVALQSLANDSPACFDERMRELAYLANVMLAGVTLDGKRLRPADATNGSLQTVALGATLVAREQNPGLDAGGVSANELQTVLRDHSADRLFRKASGYLAGRAFVSDSEAFVRSREQLETLLATNIETGS
jgi:hypothetical protein